MVWYVNGPSVSSVMSCVSWNVQFKCCCHHASIPIPEFILGTIINHCLICLGCQRSQEESRSLRGCPTPDWAVYPKQTRKSCSHLLSQQWQVLMKMFESNFSTIIISDTLERLKVTTTQSMRCPGDILSDHCLMSHPADCHLLLDL